MTQAKAPLSVEAIESLVFQLTAHDLMNLIADIEERLQTAGMMKLSESGFQDWNDKEEDIYHAEP
jgi:hypothetical protein